MFAVIRTGGKQYRVAAEDVIKVDKLNGEPGQIVQIGDVLVVGGDAVTLGVPTVAGASVAAEVLEQGRGSKIIVFKKRRRKNSRRKRGHRQEFTLLRITEILTEGAQPSKAARGKAERKRSGPEVTPDSQAAQSIDQPRATEVSDASQVKAKQPKTPATKKKPAKPKSGGKDQKK